MNTYLMELAIVHLTLVGAYWFFLRNENQYGKMRFYILASTLLAVVIPLLKLPQLFVQQKNIDLTAVSLDTITLTPMTVVPAEQNGIDSSTVLLYAYLSVCLLFFTLFIFKIYRIYQLSKTGREEHFHSTRIKRVNGVQGSFTFFNSIFLGDDYTEKGDLDAIIRHEKAHASLGHTYDLLFLELFKVAFWWLPSAWMAQKEIKKIHEYQADAAAIRAFSIDRYSSILISSTLKSHGLSLASSFHDGLIFKRLNAMKQKAKNVSPWKLGAILMITSILFVVFACNEEMEENIQEMGKSSRAIAFEQLPANMQTSLMDLKDDLTFLRIEKDQSVSEEAFKASFDEIDELKDMDPATIHSINVIKEENSKVIYIAMKKSGVSFDYLADQSKQQGNVFTVVEKMPEYPGGTDALYAHIAKNIRYPEEARKQGIEGRVYVEFIVERDGSITGIQALKGIGFGCDEEAVRVVGTADAFTPGEQRGRTVRTKMVLPILFKLNKESKDERLGVVVIDELEMTKDQLKVTAQIKDGIWTGTIYDAEGKVLAGVNIVEEGTSNGTVSDLDGTFTLQPTNKKSSLVLSFVGYENAKLAPGETVSK